MDQDEEGRSSNQLKWKSKSRSRRSGKPYERPAQQSFVNRITSTVSSIIPSWIKGAASNFLLPVNETGEDQQEISDSEHEVEEEEEEDGETAEAENINNEDNGTIHRPVDHPISDPQSPFDPVSRMNRYPLTSTARKTKITSATVSRLEKQLAKSKMKIQQQQQQQQRQEELDLDELPDGAGPSNAVDDDRSSTSENTASSTSGCSSLVPSHPDHHPQLQPPQLHQTTRIHFPKDSLERLRIELMKKKQNPSGRSSVIPSDGQSRPSSSAAFAVETNRHHPGSSSYLWSHGSVNRVQADSDRPFPTASTSRPGSSLAFSMAPATTIKSPFYDGRTAFGGSSAKRAARLVTSNPYSRGIRIPPVLHVRVSERSGSIQDNMSEAAKKILATMSSPLQDAKKIPLNEKQGMSNTTFYQSYNRPTARLGSGISTSILNRSDLPSSTSVKDQSHRMNWPIDLKEFVDKKRQVDKTTGGASENAANSSNTSCPSSRALQVDADGHTLAAGGTAPQAGGKMKSSLSSARIAMRDEKTSRDTLETLTKDIGVPHVPLPVPKNLPSFSFAVKPSIADEKSLKKSSSSSLSSSVQSILPQVAVNEFPFSSPVPSVINRSRGKDVWNSSVPVPAVVEQQKAGFPFTTSSPSTGFRFDTSSASATLLATTTAAVTTTSSSLFSSKSEKVVSPAAAASKAVVVSQAKHDEKSQKAEQPAKIGLVTVPDGISASKAPPEAPAVSSITSAPAPARAFKFGPPAAGSWICPICMIQNAADKSICAACEAIKPKPNAAVTTAPAASVQPVADPVVSKEPALSMPVIASTVTTSGSPSTSVTVSPMSTSAVTSGSTVSNSGWGATFKAPAGWTCKECFVPNKPDATKCVCCEVPNPSSGSTLSSTSAPSSTTSATSFGSGGFNFGSTVSSSALPTKSFTFGSAAAAPVSQATSTESSAIQFGSGSLFNAKTTTSAATSGFPGSSGFSSMAASNFNAKTTTSGASSGFPASSGFSSTAATGFSFGASGFSTTPATTSSSAFGSPFSNTASVKPAVSSSSSSTSLLMPAQPSLVASTPIKPAAAAFSFGQPASSQLVFGAAPSLSASPFSFGSNATSTATQPQVSSVTTVTPATTAAASISTSFKFGSTSSTPSSMPVSSPFTFGVGTSVSGSLPVASAEVRASPFGSGSVFASKPAAAAPALAFGGFGGGSLETATSSPFGSPFQTTSAKPTTPSSSLLMPVAAVSAQPSLMSVPTGIPNQMPVTPAAPAFSFGPAITPVLGVAPPQLSTPFNFTADATDASGLGSGATGERRIRKAKRRLK